MNRKLTVVFLGLVLAGCARLPLPDVPGLETATGGQPADPTLADAVPDGVTGGPDIVFVQPTQGAPALETGLAPGGVALDEEMEDIKRALVELKRDLLILEEDLLYPASSQVAVYLSMDVGEFFQLDAVTLELNGDAVAHHLYTARQVDALHRGGVQRLYTGNVKQGENRVTAFFTGRGPSGRDYRRAATLAFEKNFEPVFVELKISDSTAKHQPEFEAAVAE